MVELGSDYIAWLGRIWGLSKITTGRHDQSNTFLPVSYFLEVSIRRRPQSA